MSTSSSACARAARRGRARRTPASPSRPSAMRSPTRGSSRSPLPDQVQPAVYEQDVAPNLASRGSRPVRARLQRPLRARPRPCGARRDHGRAEGPGHIVRRLFTGGLRDARGGRRRPGRERWRARSRSHTGAAIGAARAGMIETTFAEETGADLSASRRCSAAASRARASRLRDARRGGLPAGGRVLRVPARAGS